MMEYKGYIGKVDYDDATRLLHGSVINSGPYPIANCEASDVETLKREFHLSIDEYLASCREDGVEPRKPFSGNLNLRLGPDLHQQVAASATRSGMSINGWIKQVIEDSMSA